MAQKMEIDFNEYFKQTNQAAFRQRENRQSDWEGGLFSDSSAF